MATSCFSWWTNDRKQISHRKSQKFAAPPVMVPPPRPPPPPGGSDNPLYQWITPEEKEQIAALRAGLDPEERAELESAPEYIRHDLMLCRFLRGHGARALEALRAHLQHRREHDAFLTGLRHRLPAGMEDFDQGQVTHIKAMMRANPSLEVPAKQGTNDGMCMNFLVARCTSMRRVAALSDQEVTESILSALEQRCMCLHNQSLREGRIAKVIEVKDLGGFNYMTFFTSLAALRKFAIVVRIAVHYPELCGTFLLANLDPGSTFVKLIERVLPKAAMKKLICAKAGDWEALVCDHRGLSCSALALWLDHGHALENLSWQSLTPASPRAAKALQLGAGKEVTWLVTRREESGRAPALLVKVHFFLAGEPAPALGKGGESRKLLGGEKDSRCFGRYCAPADGTLLLEVVLEGGHSQDVVLAHLALGPPDKSGQPLEAGADSLQPPVPLPPARLGAKAGGSHRIPWTAITAILPLLLLVMCRLFVALE